MFKNSCWVVISLIILLSACNNGSSTINSFASNNMALQQPTAATNPSLPFVMGGTYDSMSDYPATATTCLTAGNNLANVKILNPQATIFFTQEQSLQSVENALGVSISLTIGWGFFSTTATYQYAQSSQDNNYTLNLNYIYQYAGTAVFNNNVLLQGESALTPEALSVLGNPTQFRQMCGDNFISQMDAGASVLIRLSLTFNSLVEKNYFTTSFSQITGLDNVLSLIAANTNGVNFTLTASGIQVGGNPNLLNQIFTSNGGTINSDGYAQLNCGTGAQINSSSCINLVNQIINYSSSIANQLNNVSDYYFSNPTLTPWNTAGIFPGDVNPNPEVLNAMQQLATTYAADKNTYAFITQYENMLSTEGILSAPLQQDLSELATIYQQILAIYLDPNSQIMDCYDGFVSTNCLTISSNIMNLRSQILNNYPSLNATLTYLENSQYLARLLIDPSGFDTATCMLYPISEESASLYAVNCNGQVSSSGASNSGIQIIPNSNSIQINNLSYTYDSNQFSYQFSAPLIPDAFYSNSYDGSSNIFINGNQAFTSDFLLASLFY